MFIFCKVKVNKKTCNMQSWAVGRPFAQIFRCPIHRFVDADGNRYEAIQETLEDGS